MSTPDEPTRRVPETADVIEEDPAWRADVADEFRSMRNALFGVGLLALLALALGVYTLATRDDDDNGNNREAVSSSEVQDLEKRVDRLQSRVGNRASASEVQELQDAQSQTGERLDALEEQVGQGDDGETQQLEQSIDDLSSDLQQLSERVDELEQEQQ